MARLFGFLRKRETENLSVQPGSAPQEGSSFDAPASPQNVESQQASLSSSEQMLGLPQEAEVPERPRQLGAETEVGREQYEQQRVTPEAQDRMTQRVRPTAPAPTGAGDQTQAQAIPQAPKTRLYRKVEAILSDDLEDIYLSLDPQTQEQFRRTGEETVTKIEVLINTAKATAKAIVELIRVWLQIIPGVNRFFLEQESKLKTDRIMKMIQEQEDEFSEKF